ncbi:MAG: lipocalin family protein [Bacteroidota bacterium]
MKKLLYPFAIISLFAAFLTLTSCEREELEPTTENKLVGKWTFEAAIANSTTYGVNRSDTNWFSADDYFDFKADGTVSIMALGVSYDGTWKITGEKLFFTNTGYVDYTSGFELPILTQSDLQLYHTQDAPPDHYFEGKLNFKR